MKKEEIGGKGHCEIDRGRQTLAPHLGDKRIHTPKICGAIAHAEEAGARDGHGGDAVDREVKENRGRRNDESLQR